MKMKEDEKSRRYKERSYEDKKLRRYENTKI
jgi:hypothetical protein